VDHVARLAVLLALLLAAPASASGAHLALRGHAVRGSGFHARERVTLSIRPGRDAHFYTRHVTASSSGTFSQSLTSMPSPPCGSYWITATGADGSRARLAGMKFPDCIVR
jgi:hypothetical protein